MLPSQKAESFVGIIVWVFILSIVILGIANLIIYSATLVETYKETTRLWILKDNLANVIQKIDTSEIRENEIFYLYKNTGSTDFQIFTGTTNAGYKYIDSLWNHIADVSTFQGDIYSRIL